jgi:hypothetical protein
MTCSPLKKLLYLKNKSRVILSEVKYPKSIEWVCGFFVCFTRSEWRIKNDRNQNPDKSVLKNQRKIMTQNITNPQNCVDLGKTINLQ